jgi:release factor glutamine methyltransferase
VTTYSQLLNNTQKELSIITEEAQLESELLLEYSFNITKAALISMLNDEVLDNEALLKLASFVSKRKTGMPLAYVLENWFFRGHKYTVKPGVLVPRPETELLIEQTEKLILNNKLADITILEVGFGSGIISIELALAFPEAQIYAWDISDKAFSVAQENVKAFQVKNVTLIKKDFFSDIATVKKILSNSKNSLLVSNPPYIPTIDIGTLDSVVKDHEPTTALDGGTDGLDFYRRILCEFANTSFLNIFLEIGVNQKPDLVDLLEKYNLKNYFFYTDLANIPRVLEINK